MRLKNLVVFVFIFLANFYTGCKSHNKKLPNQPAETTTKSLVSPEYDLAAPVIIKLPPQLNEISGLSFYPRDTSLFAIVDEDGILYKIYLNRNYQVENWRFDKKSDFEDVVLHDSTFYVLISNGDIEQLQFDGTNLQHTKSDFSGNSKNAKNEFESFYYDDKKGLVLICKDCEDDKKKAVSAVGYNPSDNTYTPLFDIDVQPVDAQLGEQKIHLKPSAAAINPVTNELYILCSVNKLLVITDRAGNFKNVFTLDEKIYKQPEGLAFTPAGDLIIANEWHEEGTANLLILKRK